MATTYKVLGQSNPSATTATTLYTVPSATQAVISTITICNQAATSASYRIAVRPAGATLAAQHYVAYDIAIAANDTTALTLGIALSTTDVVTVYAATANLSFSAFGSEIA
jgi:hypothetical protein